MADNDYIIEKENITIHYIDEHKSMYNKYDGEVSKSDIKNFEPIEQGKRDKVQFDDDLQRLIFEYYCDIPYGDMSEIIYKVLGIHPSSSSIRKLFRTKYELSDYIHVVNQHYPYAKFLQLQEEFAEKIKNTSATYGEDYIKRHCTLSYHKGNDTLLINGKMFYQIKESPDYYVHEDGEVYNAKLDKFRSHNRHKRSRYSYDIVVCIDGKNVTIHKLIASMFLSDEFNLLNEYFTELTVDHIDGDPTHNSIDNLQWLPRNINSAKGKLQSLRCHLYYVDKYGKKFNYIFDVKDFYQAVLNVIERADVIDSYDYDGDIHRVCDEGQGYVPYKMGSQREKCMTCKHLNVYTNDFTKQLNAKCTAYNICGTKAYKRETCEHYTEEEKTK